MTEMDTRTRMHTHAQRDTRTISLSQINTGSLTYGLTHARTDTRTISHLQTDSPAYAPTLARTDTRTHKLGDTEREREREGQKERDVYPYMHARKDACAQTCTNMNSQISGVSYSFG